MSCRNGLLPLKQTLELRLAEHQQKHRLAGQVGDFDAVEAVALAFAHGADRVPGADLQFLNHLLHLLCRLLGGGPQLVDGGGAVGAIGLLVGVDHR